MSNNSAYNVISKIKKGHSFSKKYKAVYNDEICFIKTTAECDLNRKKNEKRVLDLLWQSEVGISRLIDLYVDGSEIISVYSWVEGVSLSDYLKVKSDSEQYKIGELLGRQLSIIHSLKLDLEGNYPTRIKLDNQIKNYLTCNLRYQNDAGWLEFIYQNIDFLGNRESVFLHNDFQAENIMVSDNIPIVLDFERFQIGDPYYDLKRVIVDACISKEYATGVIDGYFNNFVPAEFWRVSAFYIAIGTLAALAWFKEGTEEYNDVLFKIKSIDVWYNNFNEIIPSWYKETHNIYSSI